MAAVRTMGSSAIALAAVVALVVAGLVLDAVVGPVEVTAPSPVEAPLLAGRSTCAAVALGDASTVTATSVASSDTAAAGESVEVSASLALEQDGDSRPLLAPDTTGAVVATDIVGDVGDVGDAALVARWQQAPVLLSRRWVIDDTDRVPGSIEGPCPEAAAERWIVPGVATAGGASAQLHLANPTDGPAALAVSFTTPDGPVAPTRLANLVVPAHGRTTVDLNEFAPEEPDLGIVVQTRAGQVVAEVVQTLEAAVGGVDGRALVAAHSETSEIWTVPWVAARDGESAWVWVTNAGEQPTDVRLVLHTTEGPVVPPAAGVTLAPGTTERIDLRGALAEVGTGAVTVRSDPGVPIVASGAVLRVAADDPVRGGIAVVEGLPATAGAHAALSAVGATDRGRVLALANPTDEPATVTVRVVGAGVPAPVVVSEGLALPAGASALLDLDEFLPLEGGLAVLVDVTQGAASATLITTSDAGPLDLTAAAVRAFPATVETVPLIVRRDRSILHPIERDDDPAVTGTDGQDLFEDPFPDDQADEQTDEQSDDEAPQDAPADGEG